MLIPDVCGGWEKRVEIPSDRSRWGTIDEVSESNERILRDIFSGKYPTSSSKEILPNPTEAVVLQIFKNSKNPITHFSMNLSSTNMAPHPYFLSSKMS